MTSSLSLLREPRSRPAGFPDCPFCQRLLGMCLCSHRVVVKQQYGTIEDSANVAGLVRRSARTAAGKSLGARGCASVGSLPRERCLLESVRKHQAGLQSFRSMRRIEASRRNASALRLRFSQSFASLRQRLSQAKVRSTTQRRGSTTNPFVRSERLTISVSSCRQDLRQGLLKVRPLVATIGKELF